MKFVTTTSTIVIVAPGEPVIKVNQNLKVSVEPATNVQFTVKPAVLDVQVGGF